MDKVPKPVHDDLYEVEEIISFSVPLKFLMVVTRLQS